MKKRLYTLLVIAILGISSCDDDVLQLKDPSNVLKENFYKNNADAVSALTGVYASLQAQGLVTREYFFVHDMLSDEMKSGGGGLEAERARMLQHVFSSGNPLIQRMWSSLYRMIHRANLLIDNVPGIVSDDLNPEQKARYIAEAKFLRAFAYYELVSLWCEVPLILKSIDAFDTIESIAPGIASADDVYTAIFDDLDFAIENLPMRSEYEGGDIGRATKGAARALAARAHMFRGDNALAKPFLTDIIASGEYSLMAEYLDNFTEENENNQEALFEVQFTNGGGLESGIWASGDGAGNSEVTVRGQEYSPVGWTNLVVSDDLVAAFEKNDPRFKFAMYQNGDKYSNGDSILKNTNHLFPAATVRKNTLAYKQPEENLFSGINQRIIRYAEVLLMMAEVVNAEGDFAGAVRYLNQIRNRSSVDMANYPTTEYPCSNTTETFDAIVHEKQVELCFEQIRNRDIRRWRKQGVYGSVNASGPIGDKYEAKHNCLPKPVSEMDNNPNINAQPEGW